MRDRKVIEEMVALAERFGQKIEFDEFDGRGGWCRVKGTDRVIINERLTPREQIRILAQVLAGYPIEEQAMAPKIRQIIEEARLELQPEPDQNITKQDDQAPTSNSEGGQGFNAYLPAGVPAQPTTDSARADQQVKSELRTEDAPG